jgi:hypothetical protein
MWLLRHSPTRLGFHLGLITNWLFNSLDYSIMNIRIVAILLDEDAKQLSPCQGLYAAVSMNPLGDCVSHSHFQVDWETLIGYNTVHSKSVAMMLQNEML